MACVTDSNIWIDLAAGELLDEAFRLPFRWVAPDAVVAELLTPDGQELKGRGLVELGLSGTGVLEVLRLRGKYPSPSITDLFALALAKTEACLLLTGNRHLRLAAEGEGNEVHGTLWLLDEMVARRVVNTEQAAQALDRMVAQGRRLPAAEVQLRLVRWRRGK